ncbi:MAG: acetolactate synthase large subunit [Pseudomonadota bacterium]
MSGAVSGAQVLLEAVRAAGVRICFANPGTTELAVVRALPAVPGVRAVPGLFEGVCTGAADGYARITREPALTLLHLGPGLANGLANLHNARRAHSPIINVIGDHATWHLRYDAPLTSDIESLARPMSGAVLRLTADDSIVKVARSAVQQSLAPPGQIVTLIAPSDLMEGPAAAPFTGAAILRAAAERTVPAERINEAAERLKKVERPIILLGHDTLRERGLRAAQRVAAATGARLLMETYPAVVELGGDLPPLERLAYFPQDLVTQLGNATVLIAGTRPPVSYFGYPGQPSEFVPPERLVTLSVPGEDGVLALENLAERLGAVRPAGRSSAGSPLPATAVPASAGQLTPVGVAEELARQLPEGAVVSLEGSTCGGPFLKIAHRAKRHALMTNTGGAIGQGIPCGLGAALARPESRIVCLQSDGSAQYTVQALWTLAREELNVTVIIAANHRYAILETELSRTGADVSDPVLASMTRLVPRVDWVALARGYGVPGVRVDTGEAFSAALVNSLATRGPFLIQAELL